MNQDSSIRIDPLFLNKRRLSIMFGNVNSFNVSAIVLEPVYVFVVRFHASGRHLRRLRVDAQQEFSFQITAVIS